MSLVDGNVQVWLSAPAASVIVLLAVSVFPSAIANVEAVAGAVIAILLIDVAVAAPSVGVTNVGDVENTKFVDVVPVVPPADKPVMLLKAVRLAEFEFVPPFATGRTPVTPVVSGNPVRFVAVPEAGVPSTGPVNVGEVSVLFVSVCEVVLSTVTPVSMAIEVPVIVMPLPAVYDPGPAV